MKQTVILKINPSTLRTRKFRINHPNYMKEWKKSHRKNVRLSEKKQRIRIKKIVINHYSNGTNSCKCCSEKIFEFLTIDHINEDGAKHKRRENITNGHQLYTWLRRHNFPEGFQVLCWNCNTAKHYHKICPHMRIDIEA